ncbi:hypothetical protein FKM82_007882 [Ascaphus truei]
MDDDDVNCLGWSSEVSSVSWQAAGVQLLFQGVTMSAQNLLGEAQNMGQNLLVKLKMLPQADTVEIVSFVIILVFIAAVLLMIFLACCYSCCGKAGKSRRVVRVQPNPTV